MSEDPVRVIMIMPRSLLPLALPKSRQVEHDDLEIDFVSLGHEDTYVRDES